MAIKSAKRIGVAGGSLGENLAPPLNQAFEQYDGPEFAIRFWDDSFWISPGSGPALFEFWLRNDSGVRSVLTRPDDLAFGEAFVEGDLYINGDFFLAAREWPRILSCVKDHQQFDRSEIKRLVTHSADSYDRFLHLGRKHSKARDKAGMAIFEQSPDFYRRFLGDSMLYSCGLFDDARTSLNSAQIRKMEFACRKLGLRPNARYLDIGCGWGALLLYAAGNHSVRSFGITLSSAQAAFAKKQAEEGGLSSVCQVDQRDYRDLDVIHLSFDSVSSIGVTEYVGRRNIDSYFANVFATLSPGGLFLNESLTNCKGSTYPLESVVDHFAMPDRELLSLSSLISSAEGTGFEVRDVEDLREQYVRTLRCWLDALQANEEECIKLADKHLVRRWKLFLAATASSLDRGELSAYQMLLSKSDHGGSTASKTRSSWYENRSDRPGVEM